MSLDEPFESFIRNGLYLKGWSDKALIIGRWQVSSRAFVSRNLHPLIPVLYLTEPRIPPLRRLGSETWVIWMRRKGLSPACINIYLRAMNAFCSWLHENGHHSVF